MFSNGPPHMAEQKLGDQLEPIYSSSEGIRDVALRTCQKRWTMGRSGEGQGYLCWWHKMMMIYNRKERETVYLGFTYRITRIILTLSFAYLVYWTLLPISLGNFIGVFFLLARLWSTGWLYSIWRDVFSLFFCYWFVPIYQFVWYFFLFTNCIICSFFTLPEL